MNYKDKAKSYNFWVDRIKKKKRNQICTNDVALDALETNQILSKLISLVLVVIFINIFL